MVAERSRQNAPQAPVRLVRAVDAPRGLVGQDSPSQATLRARIAASPVCRNGHVRTAATTHIRPNGWMRCRVCAADVTRLRAREQRARRVPPAVCRAGHRQTFRTAFRDKAGNLRCRPCLQEWGRTHGTGGSPRRDRCRQGHELTGENVGRTRTGARFCRTCRRVADRRNAARRREARKATQTPQPLSIVPGAPERPLEGFDAIAVAVGERVRAYTPTRYVDLVEAGIRERRAREATRAMGPVTPEAIIAAAAATFGVEVADLTGKDRHIEYTRPRQLACYLIRELCPDVTLESAGQALGGRDHTTCSYSVDKVARLVAAGDRETVRDVEMVKEALGVRA